MFMKSEYLDSSNAWIISGWKLPQKAQKRIDIWKSLPILIIPFKCFSNNQKVQSFVEFPFVIELKSAFNYLFVFCNHYVSLISGKYKALSKNSITNKWFK